jgi:hypothetical protein
MSAEQKFQFEFPTDLQALAPWPEIGSRAFLRAVVAGNTVYQDNDWIVVQQGNYRYLVSQADSDFVQIVLREYLACRVAWH